MNRIVFFGTPSFAVPTLTLLHARGFEIAAVVTAPDKPVGRKAILTSPPVKITAQELGIPVLQPIKISEIADQLKALEPTVGVIVAYGKIIPQSVLDLFPKGVINIHPSLLPLYRGASPIQSALLDGKKTTGVSIMLLDAEMDHGPLLAQESWDIPSDADELQCEAALADMGATMLCDVLPRYLEGTVTPQQQDHTQATFTKKFEHADGKLDWTQPARALHNRVRALASSVGTWTILSGATLKVLATRAVSASAGVPGTIVKTTEGIGVVCGDGTLILDRIQPEGKQAMDTAAFANGHPEFVGSVLG